MRVVIAPQGFKESLDAGAVAAAIADGVRLACPEAAVVLCPVADGGEGTVAALVLAGGFVPRRDRVSGPLGGCVDATWGRQAAGDAAVVEMAAAAGLGLVPLPARNPGRTTTTGVGELVLRALADGARRVLVGAGGSATTDGGAGLLQALGVVFHDARGPIAAPISGARLAQLTRVDTGRLRRGPIADARFEVLCDVDSPLFGPGGAACVFAAQKGARVEQVGALDHGLRCLAALFPDADPGAPGSGAGGGIAFGLAAALGARLVRGGDAVLAELRFAELVRGADLVLTGEGRLDAQTAHGKAPFAVAVAARRAGVPAVALVGRAGRGAGRLVPEPLAAYVEIGASSETRGEGAGTVSAPPPVTLAAGDGGRYDPQRTREALTAAAAEVTRRWRHHHPGGTTDAAG